MPVIADQGILIMATDGLTDRIAALNLAVSIRANDPFAKIALVYSKPTLDPLESKSSEYTKWFDYLIDCPTPLLSANGDKESNIWPRLYAYELSPFRRTLYLDRRSIFYRRKRLSGLLDQLRGQEFAMPNAATHPIEAGVGPHGLTPQNLLKYYGRCSDSIHDVSAIADYFERSSDNETFYSLARKAYSESPLLAQIGNNLLRQRTALIIATYQIDRRPDNIPFRAIQWRELLEKGTAFSESAFFGYTFSESDPTEAYDNYTELMNWYAKPRALELDSKITDTPFTSTMEGCAKSAKITLPAYSSSTIKTVEKTKANIPYDVHQIWINLDGSNTLPDRYIPMINTWFTKSSHNHILHSHNDLLYLLANDYPQFLEFYQQATYITEKSDICRYLLMHKYGGVYMDADMVCLKPLSSLLATLTRPICMSLEPPAHQFWNRVLVGSAFIASKPGLDLWIELVEFMQKYYKPNSFPVLTTGPIIVDYFLHSHGYKNQIELIDSQYVFPTDTSSSTSSESEATLCRHEWTGLDTWLAQVPLGIRQALYAKEHNDINALHAYMDEAMDPEYINTEKEELTINRTSEEYIRKLELALQESQAIARNQESRIQKLDANLQEAQHFVQQRSIQVNELQPALREAQKIVIEREKQLERQNEKLREAQNLVNQRDALIKKLDPALKEAQKIVRQREEQIKELEPGLQQAQSIVQQQTNKIQKLDAALREAQSYVRKRETDIQLLENTLRQVQN